MSQQSWSSEHFGHNKGWVVTCKPRPNRPTFAGAPISVHVLQPLWTVPPAGDQLLKHRVCAGSVSQSDHHTYRVCRRALASTLLWWWFWGLAGDCCYHQTSLSAVFVHRLLVHIASWSGADGTKLRMLASSCIYFRGILWTTEGIMMGQSRYKHVPRIAYCTLAEQGREPVLSTCSCPLDTSDFSHLALLALVQWFLVIFTYKTGELDFIWCQIVIKYFIGISESWLEEENLL